ncbi:hypothetical protein UFOVP61_8 [uncultured Caudovirales phage]|uniref:Uncharacterized protein n=1 Tax=uncultured Caudovirales phage TaxID=2100421 RepID=A0A6J5KU86_9CAUD|nr:hypothetical protein UFOVP61_8 [uncultured Caudovirales phage]
MCLDLGRSAPSAPAPPTPPQAPQDPQISDLADARKKRQAAAMSGGGTLLTGPTGIENNQLNTGRGSLLGS